MPYVVTLLKYAPKFEWYIVSLVVEVGHKKDNMIWRDWTMHSQYIHYSRFNSEELEGFL